MESEKAPVHKARGKVFPELRHRQLKEQAIAFYSEHKVQNALETLLNEMFLHAPVDVYGFMVSIVCACNVSVLVIIDSISMPV